MHDPKENYNRRYRGYKVDKELRGYSMEEITQHCQRVSAKIPEQISNCINLNCTAQKYYIECFEVLRDRKECIKNLRFEVEQNGHYRLSHLKID